MFNYKPLAALVALACAQSALAAEVTRLDEVVVTATRVADKVKDLSANVSVITASDIASSPARTVQELLSTVAGIYVRNNTGSVDTAMVDLRGFGLTSQGNTLILVDGVKQNINDSSAPDLGVVPLGQIERIEVIRGSGAVAYGGGATAGVVNIITRSGFKVVDGVQATLTVGSYDLKKLDVSGHASGQQVALDGYVKTMTTDNYRANNAERNDSAGLSATVQHDGGDVRLYARTSNKDLRLPSDRTEAQFANDPRGTSTPDDYMDIKMNTYGVQARQALGAGVLSLDVSKRDKDLKAYQYSSISTYALDEQSQSVRYEQELGPHRVVLGLDALQSDTDVDNYYGKKHIDQQLLGGFVDLRLRPFGSTTINMGVRSQRVEEEAKGSSDYLAKNEIHAWSLGLRQALTSQLDAYAKLGRSFRVANADEQAVTLNNELLAPQTSQDKELGAEWRSASYSLRGAWFRYDLNNEIAFDPVSYNNVNLEPTRRQGVELEAKAALAANLELSANLTWQQAEFRKGSLAGNEVPLVPKQLANIGVSWLPQEQTRLGVQVQHVGRQRLDNDQDNTSSKRLGDYTLLNAKVSHRFNKMLSADLVVNNLTDKRYATYGGTWGGLYPAAGRNYQASVTINY